MDNVSNLLKDEQKLRSQIVRDLQKLAHLHKELERTSNKTRRQARQDPSYQRSNASQSRFTQSLKRAQRTVQGILGGLQSVHLPKYVSTKEQIKIYNENKRVKNDR